KPGVKDHFFSQRADIHHLKIDERPRVNVSPRWNSSDRDMGPACTFLLPTTHRPELPGLGHFSRSNVLDELSPVIVMNYPSAGCDLYRWFVVSFSWLFRG
ncbi:hypothetical protein KIL84_003613, partial [Mauremys mutica]